MKWYRELQIILWTPWFYWVRKRLKRYICPQIKAVFGILGQLYFLPKIIVSTHWRTGGLAPWFADIDRNKIEKVTHDFGTPKEIIRPAQFLHLNPLRHKDFGPLLFLPAFTLTVQWKSGTIHLSRLSYVWMRERLKVLVAAIHNFPTERRAAYPNSPRWLILQRTRKARRMCLHNSDWGIWRTVFGKEENQRLRHRHPAPWGGGLGPGLAPGDTKILWERGRAERVPGVERETTNSDCNIIRQVGCPKRLPTCYLSMSYLKCFPFGYRAI